MEEVNELSFVLLFPNIIIYKAVHIKDYMASRNNTKLCLHKKQAPF
jgi:hypothetical protein